MEFNYLFWCKHALQITLVIIFLKFFGYESWKKFQAQKVITTSEQVLVDLPPPAITICAFDSEKMIGFPNLLEDSELPVDFHGKLVEKVCEGLEGKEIPKCIEESAYNRSFAVEYLIEGYGTEKTLPNDSFWKSDFTHGITGMCQTYQSQNKLGVLFKDDTIVVGLNLNLSHSIFVHDPNFFVVNYNPMVPQWGILIDSQNGKFARKFIVVQHYDIDVPQKRCNPQPEYIFNSCIKTTLSRRFGCRLPWDTWSKDLIPLCGHIGQYK